MPLVSSLNTTPQPKPEHPLKYTFTGGTDGANPNADLLQDEEGNLYSTAVGGGDLSCSPTYGCGVVFKIARDHCAEGDETTERPRVVLPENARELLQQRLRFGRFGVGRMGPQ